MAAPRKSRPPAADALLHAAHAAYLAGRRDEAESLLRQVLARDPVNTAAWNNLASLLAESGFAAEAESAYRKAIALNPGFADFHANLGNLLKDANRRVEAEQAYRQAIDLKPGHALALAQLAQLLKEEGRPADAEGFFRRSLAADPASALAHNNLGILLLEGERFVEAEAAFRRAVKLKPDFADALCNLGNLLKHLRKFPEAEAAYRRAIELKVDFALAHNNLGILLEEADRAAEAEAAYRSAAAFAPGLAEAHNNLGRLLLAAERRREAEACFRRAIELRPDFANAHGNLGNLLKQTGRAAEAEAAYRRAIEFDPHEVGTCNNLAILLAAERRFGEAEAAFRRAIELKPDSYDAYNNLGNLLKEAGRVPQAEAAYRHVLELNPGSAEALSNLGVLLFREKRFEEAENALRRAVELKPAFADGHNNLGNLLKQTGRLADAEAAYRHALELQPGYPEARLNLGLLLLSLGRYVEAWPYHEARHYPDTKERQAIHPKFAFPQWQGESLQGKTLVIYTEQGHGDNVQFVRYAPLLKARGLARLTLVQTAALIPLVQTVAGVDAVVDNLAAVPTHDYWCFPLSLPLHLGTTVDNIPATLPYLRVLPERAARWRQRIPGKGFKVGLVWKGNPEHKEDIHRSISSLSALAPLWRVPGISFVSLQKGEGEEEARNPPPGQPLLHLGNEIADFADTAAIIAELDLLITIDSAVAHVAGALGKPVWVLLPAIGTDWRWLRDRPDSPWYPGVMRLFRQQADESWEQTAARVATALQTRGEAPDEPIAAVATSMSSSNKPAASPAPSKPAASPAPSKPAASPAPSKPAASPDPATLAAGEDTFPLALAAYQAGRFEEAEAILRRMLARAPTDAACWNNLGNLLQETRRLDEAEAAFRQAIALTPFQPEFQVNLGNLLRLAQRLPESEAAYRRALEILPDNPDTHNRLGNLLKEAQRPNEAEAAYRRALELKPDFADAHNDLGILLKDLGKRPEAEAAYRRALELRPQFSEAHNNLGILLLEMERFPEAEAAFRRAIELKPDFADLHSNLGNLLKQTGLYPEAQAAYRRAIELNPKDAMAHNNLGVLLQEAENLVEAEQAYRHALAAKPDFGEAFSNQGILLQHMDQLTQAEAAYRHAIELKPDCTDARLNLGLLLLGVGRYAEAWAWHEARHVPDSKARKAMQPHFDFPQWQGESLAGKSLVVVLEQGYGDNIQFARHAPLLKARGLNRLSFLQPAALIPLLATVQGIDFITPDGASVPRHDYWCFPLSIPLHLGTTLETIPDALPYVWALPEWVEHWRPRLPAGFKVGLAWKGNPEHKNDTRRSLPHLSALAPLWEVPGVSFISLQKGAGEDEARAAPAAQPLLHLGSDIRDFADSAAIVAQLDLLITIDSAAAHLAGALGKPVWVLLPGIGCDWRWLRDRADSPWYPEVMRLFRQPRQASSWVDTIHEVAAALRDWIAVSPAPTLPLLDHPLAEIPAGVFLPPGARSTVEPAPVERKAPALPDPARPPLPAGADELLQAAHAAYLAGRRDEAEALLRRFLEQDPANAAAWNNLGILLQESGKTAEAEAAYRSAAAALPSIPDFHVSLGNFLKTVGRPAEAETAYRQAVACQPGHVPTLALLAELLKEGKRPTEAEAMLRQAIALQPDHAQALAQLAQILKETQRLGEAEDLFHRATALDPGLVLAHNNLGILLLESDRPQQAEASFRQAVALDETFALGHCNLGNALRAQKQLVAAEASYRRALFLQPDDISILNNLGVLLGEAERRPESEAMLRRVTAIAPESADGWNNLGNALQDQGRLAEAEATYRKALVLNPSLAASHTNLGNALKAQDRVAEAEAAYLAALALNPDDTNTLNNLGVLLLGTDHYEEARARLMHALAVKPDFSAAWCNLGNVVQELASPDEAESAYRKAIEFNPDFTDAKVNLGLLLLRLGRYAEAWPYYDAGHLPDSKARREIQPPFSFPQWQGEPLLGKSLVVATDQGHGDNIQCARYAPLLKAQGLARLSFFQPTALIMLLATVEGLDAVTAEAAAVPPHDYWCFSLSLPLRLGTTLDTIPGTLPYLRALPDRVDRWRPRLEASGLKVGLVWKGNPNHKNDARRSLPHLSALAPLWEVPGISFFSLQKGQGEDQARPPPPGQPLLHLGDDITDFADSAAIIAQLDLLITVDSATAHLAGALGKPVWVLLPGMGTDWRWLREGEDSPWYPKVMRLFRQPREATSWEPTLRGVAAELRRWSAASPQAVVAGEPPVPGSAYSRGAPTLPLFAGVLPEVPADLLGAPPATPASDASAAADAVLQEAHSAFLEGRRDEAEHLLRRIVTGDPRNAAAWNNLALLLQDSGRAAETEAAYRNAIEASPGVAQFQINFGRFLRNNRRFAEAEAPFRAGLALSPLDSQLHLDLGDVLVEAGRLAEAESAYRQAVFLDPELAAAHGKLAIALHRQARLAEAEAEYRRALVADPGVRGDLAVLLLEEGRWAEAWPHFDYRSEPFRRQRVAEYAWPEWRGEDLAGKSLLIDSFEADDDNIMCARYASLLKASGASRVTLFHRPALKPLLETVAGVDAVLFAGDSLPPHDFWCFSSSLPSRFGTTPTTIPAQIPYAFAREARVTYWGHRLAALKDFRVGLVWKADANTDVDRAASLPALATLAPLWDVPGVSFVGLQQGHDADQALQPAPAQPILHLGGDIVDFGDTAAIIAQVDLLISVDSAAAHVAGALGRPVWLLLPHPGGWRWLAPQRGDSPWYPGVMRIFRQSPQAPTWEAAVREMAAALAQCVRGEAELVPPPQAIASPASAETTVRPPVAASSMELSMKRPAPRPVAFVLTSSDHGTLIVNRNDHAEQGGGAFGVGHQILANSSFDPGEIDFALRMLESRRQSFGDGVTALDCGANIGIHTVEWARLMQGWGSVISIEAQERVFYALCGNITINNCFNARAIWGAVGAENGEILVPRPDYLRPGSYGSLEIRPSARNEFIGQAIDYSEQAGQRTRLFTIDSLALPRLDFLKIDIEGMEMEALAGAMNTIRRFRPQMMIEKIKSDETALRKLLLAEGYRVAAFGLNLVAVHSSDPGHQQLLA